MIGGALDWLNSSPQGQGLLANPYAPTRGDMLTNFGLGLLANSGPSLQPVGFGSAVGRAGLGATQMQEQAKQRAYQQQLYSQVAQRQQQELDQNAQWKAAMMGGASPQAIGAGMSQPGMQPGPTVQAANAVKQLDPMAGLSPQQKFFLGNMPAQQGSQAAFQALTKDDSPIAVPEGTSLINRRGQVVYQGEKKAPEGFQRNPDGSLSLLPGYAEGKGQLASLTEPLSKVMNPDGTVKYVPRSQAVGQSAPDEAMVVMGPDGKPLFMRGGSQAIQAMQSGLTKAGQDKVQDQLIDMTAQMSQVNRIKNSFKPEFQQIGTRAGLSWDAIRDKAGMNLNPQERQGVAEFAKYKAEAGQYFADRLKAMSGAAVTEQEMKRQEAYLPNPGSGVFDGDSPTQFSAKVERMQDFMQKATARLHYVSKKGMNISQVPLDDMPKIIRDRGNELAKSIEGRGLDEAAVKDAVRRQLAKEFGLVSE
jgi:hypothetical protein